ncbi:MAG: hypothetical protein SPE75_03780 [Prevotella sp.]|nr:hypothetical protein [Prevotella sp.]
MNTNNIDNERTQYDANLDERTQIDNTERTQRTENAEQHNNAAPSQPAQPIKKGPKVGRILGGAAAGVALGAAATVLSSGTPVDGAEANGGEEVPTWSDGEVPVAHGVNDDMSFTEAFNTARTEVGPGGAFEWHGNIYHTYNKTEWDNMSDDDKAAFGQHFSWTGSATAQNDEVEVVNAHTAHHTTGHTTGHATAQTTGHTAGHATAQTETAQVQPVAQGPQGDEPNYITGNQGPQPQPVASNEPHTVSEESEVQILGVSHDDETGYTFAQLSVDNHDAIMVDINGDHEFDVLAVDFNDNGKLDDNEYADISGGHITEGYAQQMAAINQAPNTDTDDSATSPVEHDEPQVMAQNDEVEPQVDDSLPVNLENDCLSEQPTADFSDDSLMV